MSTAKKLAAEFCVTEDDAKRLIDEFDYIGAVVRLIRARMFNVSPFDTKADPRSAQ